MDLIDDKGGDDHAELSVPERLELLRADLRRISGRGEERWASGADHDEGEDDSDERDDAADDLHGPMNAEPEVALLDLEVAGNVDAEGKENAPEDNEIEARKEEWGGRSYQESNIIMPWASCNLKGRVAVVTVP